MKFAATIIALMIMISELKTYSTADLHDLDALMHQLSGTSSCSEQKLRTVLESDDSHLYVARDEDRIVGSACLCIAHTTEFTLGFIEAVVVSQTYRGKHLGRQLMEYIQHEAKRLGVDSLHLTSNPKRVAANTLYQSLGFEQYDTNVYKMEHFLNEEQLR